MIMGMSSEKGFEKLIAKVPLKEMASYSTALSSLTGGRASFIMKFASYELVPSDVQDKLIKDFEAKHGFVLLLFVYYALCAFFFFLILSAFLLNND